MGSLRRIDSKGFKDFHQKRLDEKKFNVRFQISEEKKRQEKIEESRRYKSDWREETQFQENWITVAGSEPTNSTSQTFQYTGGNNLETGQPNTVTFSGLGGVESIPSTVTVDFGFGETEVVDGPTFSQFAMQGYAKPLGNITRRSEYEDVNPRLDASQEFAQTVGADYMMNARVDDGVIPNYTSTPDAPLIAQMDPQYLDKDGLVDVEKMDALFRDDPDEYIRQIQKGLAPKPPTVLPDVAPVEGETILPQALQDALNRRRNSPARTGSTRDKMDKKQILDFLDTPEGKKFDVTNPKQYAEFIDILTGGEGSLSPEQPGFRSPVQPPRDSYGDFLKKGGMIDPGAYKSALRSGLKSVGDAIANIRGSEANRPYTVDTKTGEPRYTGMNDQQYSDATNKIADKYNKLRAPIERRMEDFFFASKVPESLVNKINALNDAQTAEERALGDKRAAQEHAFNNALADYYNKQDAANQARQDALDEIDNEEDPYSKLFELGAKMEKLRREGKSVKRVEIIGPGEEGYVDTTDMANAIGYNRKIIYTAASKELYKQIKAAQDAQMAWLNDRDKRRNDAEKADYKGGQGGLPIGTTSLRGGAGSSAGARKPTPPENKSQSASLARQAASARMNPQQRRKKGMKESTTWSRLQKHR